MNYLGDFNEDQTVHLKWSTNEAGGASVTRSTDGTLYVYKDDATGTEVTTGITDTEDHDSLTGVHHCKIVTTDAFYATGADYFVVLKAATIDGETVNHPIAHFSIENRSHTEMTKDAINDLINTSSGVVESNMIQIDGNATDGYNATLKLKKLDLYNSSGSALYCGSGSGNAVYFTSSAGMAFYIYGNSASGGMQIKNQMISETGLVLNGGSGGKDIDASELTNIKSVVDDVKLKTDLLPVNPSKGEAFSISFVMYSTVTGGPKVSETVSVSVSKDDAAFGAATNTPATELAVGWYYIELTSTEMDADKIVVRCTSANCSTTNMVIYTQASS